MGKKKSPITGHGIGISEEDYQLSKNAVIVLQNRIKTNNNKEDKITLAKHHQIMKYYKYYIHHFRKSQKLQRFKEATHVVRYICAKGYIDNWRSLEVEGRKDNKKVYISNKAVVDEYEKALAKKNRSYPPSETFRTTKANLLKELKDPKPLVTREDRKKRKALMIVGIDFKEADKLANYPREIVEKLISERNYPTKVNFAKILRLKLNENEHDEESESPSQLIEENLEKPNKSKENKVNEDKAIKVHPKDVKAASLNNAKNEKLKASCESAQATLQKFEKTHIEKLTEKQKATIRICLRRIRAYCTFIGQEIPTSKFDVLLADEDEDV